MSVDKAFCGGKKSNGAKMGLIRVSWAQLGSALLCSACKAQQRETRGGSGGGWILEKKNERENIFMASFAREKVNELLMKMSPPATADKRLLILL